jgi:acetyltransferase-like isoleucine patch superfamily enzyme
MGARSILSAWDKYEDDVFNPQIMIGDGVGIGEDSHITAINRIEIGRDVLMGKKVTITDNSHGKTEYEQLSIPPKKRVLYSKGPVVIEDRVWIGDKVTILPNVRIGKNAIIAANAVITSDIPENCIAGGNPAKIIKKITV